MFSSFGCSCRNRHEARARLNAVHLTDRMCGWPSSWRHAYTGFPEWDLAFYLLHLHGLRVFGNWTRFGPLPSPRRPIVPDPLTNDGPVPPCSRTPTTAIRSPTVTRPVWR